MALSDKRQILKDRVLLLREIERFIRYEVAWRYAEGKHLWQTLKRIRADTDSMLAFSPADLDSGLDAGVTWADNPKNKWNPTLRSRSSIGRYLRRAYELDSNMLSDGILENLNSCLASCGIDFDKLPITIVRGKELVEAYHSEKYGTSCMTGEKSCHVEMYGINPDKVGVVLYNGMARALLWTTDEGKTVLDRVYPNSGVHVKIIQRWAERKGYLYRISASADAYRLSEDKPLHVTVFIGKYLPFLDTFRHVRYVGRKHAKDKRWLVLSNYEEKLASGQAFPATLHCAACGAMLWEDYDRHYILGNRGPFCSACFEMQNTLCAKCLDILPVDMGIYVSDVGEFWCNDCIGNYAFQCSSCCHCYSHDSDVVITGEEYLYCVLCCGKKALAMCSECGDIVTCYVTAASCETFCERCYLKLLHEKKATECSHCGGVDRTENGYREESGHGRWFCSLCKEKVPSYKKRAKEAEKAGVRATPSRPQAVVSEL